MKIHLLDLQRKLSCLNNELYNLKQQISSLTDHTFGTLVKHAIHDLNRVLHTFLTDKKTAKLHNLLAASTSKTPHLPCINVQPPSPAPFNLSLNHGSTTDPDKPLVRCIPTDLPLTTDERSVLSKGLNFVPLTPTLDQNQRLLDLERFFRSLRWSVIVGNVPTHSTTEDDDPISRMFRRKKPTMPKPDVSPAVESYISQCRSDILKLKPKPIRRSNLTLGEMGALRSLKQRDDIIIKPADKGGAVVVWSRDLYINEALRQLSTLHHYTPLADSQLTADKTKTFKTIKTEIDDGNLPYSGHLLKVQTPRQPYFYMLPKIHKIASPGRPIVSACSCPTEHISQYLDSVFNPMVSNLPSFIKDSTHALLLLDELNNRPGFRPQHLLTMDVTALYTNIPHNEGLSALRYYLDLRPTLYPPTNTIIRLAELVLNLNSFQFNDAFYKQVSGVAMGTKMGPSYACLFMGHIESQILSSYSGPIPEYFGRYIDDCLIISSLSEQELLNFVEFANNFNTSIKFTHEISHESISFLDILIRLNDGSLSTSVHFKPTASHSYLDYNSSHPLATRNSIPYSQFLRLRRLCSDDIDFQIQSKSMVSKFLNRHYPPSVVLKALSKAQQVPRTSALQKLPNSTDDRHRAIFTFHPHNLPVKSIILQKWSILKDDADFGRIFSSPPMIAYRKATSIRDHLVKSRLRPSQPTQQLSPGTMSCNNPSCGSCPYLDKDPKISGPGGSFTVRRTFSCNRTNVIYVIRCQKCTAQKILYVGETGRSFETRVKEHIADVRLQRDTPVARHFDSDNGHSIQDLRAQIIWQAPAIAIDRRLTESRFIKHLGTLQPSGLNLKP